jgi:hypothetical protein
MKKFILIFLLAFLNLSFGAEQALSPAVSSSQHEPAVASSSSGSQSSVSDKFQKLELNCPVDYSGIRNPIDPSAVVTPNGKYILFLCHPFLGGSVSLQILDVEAQTHIVVPKCFNFKSSIKLHTSNNFCIILVDNKIQYVYDIAKNEIVEFAFPFELSKWKYYQVINNYLVTINSENVIGIFDLSGAIASVDIESHVSALKPFVVKFNQDKVLVNFGNTKIGYDFTSGRVYRNLGGIMAFDIMACDTQNPNHPANTVGLSRHHSSQISRYNPTGINMDPRLLPQPSSSYRNALHSFESIEPMVDLSEIHEITFGCDFLLIKFKNLDLLNEGQQSLITQILDNNDVQEVGLDEQIYQVFSSLPCALQRVLNLHYQVKQITDNPNVLPHDDDVIGAEDSQAKKVLQVLYNNRQSIATVIGIGALIYYGYRKLKGS